MIVDVKLRRRALGAIGERVDLLLQASVALDVLGRLGGGHDLGLTGRERNGGLLLDPPVERGAPHADEPARRGSTS